MTLREQEEYRGPISLLCERDRQQQAVLRAHPRIRRVERLGQRVRVSPPTAGADRDGCLGSQISWIFSAKCLNASQRRDGG